MSVLSLPDLSGYRPHRTVDVAEFEGVAVPGLRAEFFRRDEDGREATAGRYRYAGRPLLLAWGFVDEAHCRFSALCDADGRWGRPVPGCPQVQLVRVDGRVTGLLLRDDLGRWIDAAARRSA
jgi:hypothetical protein